MTAVTDKSVTIKTSTGATIELSIDTGTAYHQQAAGAASDVTTGKTVVVQVSGFAGRGGQGAARRIGVAVGVSWNHDRDRD